MSSFIADPNVWYAITYGNGPAGVPYYLTPDIYLGGVYAGIQAVAPGPAQPNMSEYPQSHWQFYPVTEPPNGTYFLRSRLHKESFFYSSHVSNTTNLTACTSIGWDCTQGVKLMTVLPASAIWTFSDAQQGNSTYHITNNPHGDARLDLWPNMVDLRLSNNFTGYQQGQQWQVNSVEHINDASLLSLNANILQLPGSPLVPTNITSTVQLNSSTATSPSTSTSSISSSNTSKHSGLSIGAKAGIGAGVGVGVALLLGLILFWLLHRKKNNSAGRFRSNPPSYDGWSINANKDSQNMEEASRVPLVEAHSEVAVEAPSNPGRYELAGDFERYGEVMSPGSSPTSERTMIEPGGRFV